MEQTQLKTVTGRKVFPYTNYNWVFATVSLMFFAVSLYVIFVKGINFGVDFKGGSKMTYTFKTDIKSDEVRTAIDELALGEAQVIRFGDVTQTNQYMIRVKYIEGKNLFELVDQQLQKKFGKESVQMLSQEVVGPKVGQDLTYKAVLSIIITCVLILVYIGFRFDFLFAPGAIIALIHDVLISVGFFAYFGKEFNLPILAALLTILGYSINDTVIIFDRIRENIVRLPKSMSVRDIINISLTETFSRTIVTSLTVFMVVVVLFFLGGGVLHDFAFCMMVGVAFGTYSSIFIASPIYLFLHKLFPQMGNQVTAKRPKAA